MSELKLCGMALILGTSVWTGFGAAARVRKTAAQLDQLRRSLEIMRCEIACRLTPIRKLCRMLSEACTGELSRFYARMGERLQQGDSVVNAAAEARRVCRGLLLPPQITLTMDELFSSFGSYDYEAQLRLIDLAAERTAAAQKRLEEGKRDRCRSYEILGICAGIAIVILVA